MQEYRLGNKNSHRRNLFHLYKSGCLTVGFEHLLVVLPSALLLAKYADTKDGPLITLPMILCACGIVTLLFTLWGKPQAPFFLGPSISYIAFLSYQASSVSQGNTIAHARLTILLGYLIAGGVLFCFSLAYRKKSVRNLMHALFPHTVMGPAISLIGLQVVGTAVSDSGLNGDDRVAIGLAMITLFFIIIASLTGIPVLGNASVLFGVFIGCIFSVIFKRIDWSTLSFHGVDIPAFRFFWGGYHLRQELSSFTLSELIMLFFSILPPTIVVFLELHGRSIVFEGMLRRDGIPLKKYDAGSEVDEFRQKILEKHARFHIASVLIGVTPCTIYAQNIAVMNLHTTDLSAKQYVQGDSDFIKECHNPFSLYPYRVAAGLCILASLFTGIQNLIYLIPLPVFGGMELFLFGLIAAPGIQVLVEEQVNYKKISNQIITASVLIAGVGGVSLNLGSYELSGMSLGLLVGVIVNALSLGLKRIGWLKEKMTMAEIFDMCMDSCASGAVEVKFTADSEERTIGPERKKAQEWKRYIQEENISKDLEDFSNILIKDISSGESVELYRAGNIYFMRIWPQDDFLIKLLNDYGGICRITPDAGEGGGKGVVIELNEHITDRLLKDILKYRI